MAEIIVREPDQIDRFQQLNFILSREGQSGFLKAFVNQTARLLNADFLFVARINPNRNRMRTLHASARGEPVENFGYELDDTPCANTMHSGACMYEDHVARSFPRDYMLEEMGIRGYVGMPLFRGAQAVGIIVALFRSPLVDGEGVLKVFSHYRRRLASDIIEREAGERSRLVLAGTSDGAWDWDRQTEQVFMSARFRSLLGYHARDCSEPFERLESLVHKDDRDRMRAALAAHFTRGQAFDLCVRLLKVGGQYRWFRMRGEALRSADGDVIRMAGAITNIHDLVEARQQATEASRAKSRFLSTLSHEIRTPLNAVIGLSGLLSTGDLSEEQAEMVAEISGAGQSLLGILNDLLDLAGLESGRFDIRHDRFALTDLLQRVASPYQRKAAEKGLAFHLDLDPCLEREVCGDEDRVAQILSHILGNAVKFTERGEIRLRALIQQDQDGHHHLCFQISDTGVGMDEALMAQIFHPFFQNEDELSRQFGGAGLGLAIAQKLAELMRGEITVESAPGAGSLFQFTMPVEECREPCED